MALHDISCPHCGKAFKIDETGYADILKQVRDGDFVRQLHERLELAEQESETPSSLPKRRQPGNPRRVSPPRTLKSRS